jgi:hypothetical protein
MAFNEYGFVRAQYYRSSMNVGPRKIRQILSELALCDNNQLEDPALIPYIERHLRTIKQCIPNIFPEIFPIEHKRFDQRQKSMGVKSVILFACQSWEPNTLQATLVPYVLCAHALKYTADSYRMIICNKHANQGALNALAAERRQDIDGVDITFLDNINNFDDLMSLIAAIGEDEKLALCYISSHGSEKGLFGHWSGDCSESDLSQEHVIDLSRLIASKRSLDCQIFFNACFSNCVVAPLSARTIGDMIVMGASQTIPTSKIHHNFSVDHLTGRLYATFNSLDLSDCEIFANYIEIVNLCVDLLHF